MDNNRRKELLKKLADGTLTPNEELELWNVDNQTGQDYSLDDGEPDLSVYGDLQGPAEMEESLERIRIYQANRVRLKSQRLTIYRIAASMAAVFLLYFGFTMFADHLFIREVPVYVTIKVPKGSVQSVALPDGSKATASPGSILRYPKAFAKNERRVYLDKGEAFFEVTKNPERPFSVISGELQTTALGTSFTVQYDPIIKREKVNLYTGKVSVEVNKENSSISPVVLFPGKAYEYHAGTVTLSAFKVDSDNPIKKGLTFDEVPLEEALYRVGAWYGVSLQLQLKDNKKKISGNYNNMKDIDEILSLLSFIHDFHFKKSDSLTYKIMGVKNRKK